METMASQQTGRPRIRELVDVCKDMKVLNVKNWKDDDDDEEENKKKKCVQ
jgi:hypothetical protein